MILARSRIPAIFMEEDERLTALFCAALEKISDEEFDRIGFDAFYEDFTRKNASPAYQAYLKREEHYTDEGEYIP